MLPRPHDYARAARRVERALEQPLGSASTVIETFLTETADVLGATSACWHLTDPAAGLPVSSAVLGDPPGSLEEALEYEFRRPDVNRIRDLRESRVSAAALSLETRGELMASARFREMVEPAGAADELRVLFADPFGLWGAAAVFTRRQVTPDDVRFVRDLLPLATATLRSAIAAETRGVGVAPTDGVDGDGPAVLVLDGADHVVAADAAARARLALLPDDRDVQLPGVIAFLAAQARSGDRCATARMRGRDGRWFVVDASALDGHRDAGVAVVIQPAPVPSVLEQVLRAFGLSAREREVALLAVRGQSTKAIAASLHLSPWTVQDHLKAIYEKTGVSARADLDALVVTRVASAPAIS